MDETNSLPLSPYTVLDLTRVRAGPTAVRQLADWGADVIKIETPAAMESNGQLGGPRDGPDFENLHRNKRSITLNLKSPKGLELFKRLAEQADVVLENYRPDVKQRLGVDYDSLRAINPRLVYGSISGFGEAGPYRERPGFDQIAQGMGGLMSVTGLPGQGPVRVGIPVADLCAGIFCAQGVLVALLERQRTGQGRWVRTSLLQAQVFMLDFQAARWLVNQEVPPQAGNNHPTSIPTGVFPSRDGHVNIASAGQVIWERFTTALGLEALRDDPRYADGEARSQNREALNAAIAACTQTYTSAELVHLLNEAGVPCGPIYRINETFADPQVQHLELAQTAPHAQRGEITLVGQPFMLGESTQPLRSAAPARGAHTEDVLGQLGLNTADIAALRKENVV